MKKIIPIIMTLAILPTFATTMCAVDDSVTVVLDPSLGGTRISYDGPTGTWSVRTQTGRIYGISAMLNSNYGKTAGGTVSRLTDTNNGETHLVNGSEKYGRYCWCKITHPVMSLWVYIGTPSVNDCPYKCSDLSPNGLLIKNLFGSIAQ